MYTFVVIFIVCLSLPDQLKIHISRSTLKDAVGTLFLAKESISSTAQ